MAARPKPPQPSRTSRRRVRRAPADSRRLLLDAAEALVAARGPDALTLRQVAEAVGVTPGLVTHYFGTCEGLVRAVVRRQHARTRTEVRRELGPPGHVPDADALLGHLFAALADPRRARLHLWSLLRPDRGVPARRELRALTSALERSFRRSLPAARVPPRPRIEQVVLLALAAAHGWAAGRTAWLEGLGLDPAGPGHDEAFRAGLTASLRWLMAGGAAGGTGAER